MLPVSDRRGEWLIDDVKGKMMRTFVMLPVLGAVVLGLSACSSSSGPANVVEADNAVSAADTFATDNIDAGATNDLNLSEPANSSGNTL